MNPSLSPSQGPPSAGFAGFSGSASASSAPEKHANSSAPKPRSCVVCRSRKVRCDKLSPCSNCRRANVQCVVPSNDRPPRWARRLERVAHSAAANATATASANATANATAAAAAAAAATANALDNPVADQVMERLRNLEGLVKELSVQLEHATAASPEAGPRREPDRTSSSPSTSTTGVQQHFGRLVLQDSTQSRYIGTGFWSRVSDELDGLKMDTRGLADGDSDTSEESSPGKTPSTQELARTPSERHAFMFGHNLTLSSSLDEFRPLPSQVPFLINTFAENVNYFAQLVHVPSLRKLLHGANGSRGSRLTPANEALVFSVYYAAVTSMEDEDVLANFGANKADLNLKFRLGFERALAMADFLNAPDLTLVQALAVFLCLARRHDSPRFVWMMTGLVIRMGQAIGLHRDGSHFKTLSPFDVEMRRRVWWSLCNIDARASEDQGTDFTISVGSFDTKMPLNIDDADIDPETKETPRERQGLTDMSLARVWFEMSDVTRQIMAPGKSLEEQGRLLNSMYQKLDEGYLCHAKESGNILYWVGVTVVRLVVSKMTLLIYLPALFSSPDERFSDDVRTRLLVAAVEVAEYNHELNAEARCRQWRWIYQTYTHWYAIVYMLLEASRRDWSPVVERAWVALHSSWLMPDMDRKLQFWVPLRKLMAKARRRREAELGRLRGDAGAVEVLEREHQQMPVPGSSGPFPEGKSAEMFLEHWRRLVAPETQPSIVVASEPQHQHQSPSEVPANLQQMPFQNVLASGPTDVDMALAVPADWSALGPGFTPWLWADSEPGMDVFAGVDLDLGMEVDGDVDWNTWLESAAGMRLGVNGQES